MENASPLDWTHVAAGVTRREKHHRSATAEERSQIARLLQLVDLSSLSAHYTLSPAGDGRLRMTGTVSAHARQTCVVSLDPMEVTVEDTIEAEFGEGGAQQPSEGEEAEVLSGSDMEPFNDGLVEAGRVVFETFAAALDPYPRKPDAEFRWKDPELGPGGTASPFAALRKLVPDP